MAKVIYSGPNMHGVFAVGDRQDYWCPQGEESEDMPDDLAARLVGEQPHRFAVPKPPKTKSARAQED